MATYLATAVGYHDYSSKFVSLLLAEWWPKLGVFRFFLKFAFYNFILLTFFMSQHIFPFVSFHLFLSFHYNFISFHISLMLTPVSWCIMIIHILLKKKYQNGVSGLRVFSEINRFFVQVLKIPFNDFITLDFWKR